MRSTLAIRTARAKPRRRRQLLRKARERLERVEGPAIVPVPFLLERCRRIRKSNQLQVTPAAQRRPALRATPATLPGVPGRPTFASASSCDTDKFLSADHLTEIGEAERTTAPITVTPIRANLCMVFSNVGIAFPDPSKFRLKSKTSE